MRIADLIKLLEDWQAKHGPDAQIAVPRYGVGELDVGCGEEIYIHDEPIATILGSKGEEVEW